MSGDVHARFCERPWGKLPRSTHLVITGRGPHSNRGGAARAVPRLREHLAGLGVEGNAEKTKIVDLLRQGAVEFLGFAVRRVRNRAGEGYGIWLPPRQKARWASKARLRERRRRGGAPPLKELIAQLNPVLAGWVQYCRVGKARRACSESRDDGEMKVRLLLTRRTRRHTRSVGWRRGSNEYRYDVLGLFWDWKLRPLPGAGADQ